MFRRSGRFLEEYSPDANLGRGVWAAATFEYSLHPAARRTGSCNVRLENARRTFCVRCLTRILPAF